MTIDVTASSPTIAVSASGSSVAAAVSPANAVAASVSGGQGPQGSQGIQGPIGPQGPAGPPGTTTWEGITNKPSAFTPSAHAHGSITDAGAIGSAAGLVVVTTSGGLLGTASTIAAATQVSGLAAIATSGDGSDLTQASVSYSRLQAVSATDRLLGRTSAGSGVIEEIVCTPAGRALLDDADANAQRSTLSAQKTITAGSAPPTGGQDGDIYLQYS